LTLHYFGLKHFFAKFGKSVQLVEIFFGRAFFYLYTTGFLMRYFFNFYSLKVEKILKGSLDSIPSPSPSVKIQMMGGKVCLRWKGKILLGVVNKLFVFKSLLTSASNVLPYYLSPT